MSSRQLIAIGIRIFAIWVLLQIFFNLVAVFIALSGTESFFEVYIPQYARILVYVTYVLLGCFTAFLLFRVSSGLVSYASDYDQHLITDETQKFVFQIVGLYFLFDGIIYIPQSAAMAFTSEGAEIYMQGVMLLVGVTAQVVIAIHLISKPTFWLVQFQKIRTRE